MRVAATIAVYNEESLLPLLINALLAQTRPLDQIVIVDDGSTDSTLSLLQRFAADYPQILIKTQLNQGPATARNHAWRAATADICLFTDGDCIPSSNWAEKILEPFCDQSVGAVGGTYTTLNRGSLLANFIGSEIDWRYHRVEGDLAAHGTYCLAVRKNILERIGGFNEAYKKPSGEDFDLTYKISRISRLVYRSDARVGTHHPEKLWPYLRLQARRAYDRIRLYNDHPDRSGSDNYTGDTVKFEVLASISLVPLLLLFPWLEGVVKDFVVAAIFLLTVFLLICRLPLLRFQWQHGIFMSLYGLGVSLLRNFYWGAGLIAGVAKFGLSSLMLKSTLIPKGLRGTRDNSVAGH